MAKSWDEVLEDAKNYTDESELILGDLSLKVGDLRKLFKGQTETIETRSKDVSRREEEVASLFARLQEISDNATKSSGVEPRRAEANAAAEGQPLDYEHDPLFGPLMGEIKTAKQAAEEARKQVEQITKASSAHIAALYEETWRREWERREWKLDQLDSAKRYAMENGIKNRHGVIDPIRAFTEMTRDQTVQAQIEKVRKEAEEAGAARARAEVGASMLPFGVSAPSPTSQGKVDPKLSMEDNIRRNLREVLGKQGMTPA